MSRKSKKPKVEGEFLADDPMLQCASYALEILSHGGLVGEKYRFIMSEPPQPTSEFDALGRWVVSLQTMFRDGFSARTKYRSELAIAIRSKAMHPLIFEDETLGGFVTFDTFQAILDTKSL